MVYKGKLSYFGLHSCDAIGKGLASDRWLAKTYRWRWRLAASTALALRKNDNHVTFHGITKFPAEPSHASAALNFRPHKIHGSWIHFQLRDETIVTQIRGT